MVTAPFFSTCATPVQLFAARHIASESATERNETPASEWPGRLVRLVSDDQYGAREELLRRAELLLDETTLRALVAQYESRMASALAAPATGDGPPHECSRFPRPCRCLPKLSMTQTSRCAPC